MKASEVMRSPAVSVAPNCRVIDEVRLLMETNRRDCRSSKVPSGILVGIASEGDFLRRVELGTVPTGRPSSTHFLEETAAAFARVYGRSVDQTRMTRDPGMRSAECGLTEAIALVESHHVVQIPPVLKVLSSQ
jgi:hypothetical protein